MPVKAGYPLKREHSPEIFKIHCKILELQINAHACSKILKYNIERRKRGERIKERRENKGDREREKRIKEKE